MVIDADYWEQTCCWIPDDVKNPLQKYENGATGDYVFVGKHELKT